MQIYKLLWHPPSTRFAKPEVVTNGGTCTPSYGWWYVHTNCWCPTFFLFSWITSTNSTLSAIYVEHRQPEWPSSVISVLPLLSLSTHKITFLFSPCCANILLLILEEPFPLWQQNQMTPHCSTMVDSKGRSYLVTLWLYEFHQTQGLSHKMPRLVSVCSMCDICVGRLKMEESNCYMQEMWTGAGIVLPQTLSMPSSGWAWNKGLQLCLAGADGYL
jgi:hypothetical protein